MTIRDMNRRQLLAGGAAIAAASAFGSIPAFAAQPEFIGIIGGGTGGAWHLGGSTMGEFAKEIWPGVSVTVRAGSSTVALREIRRRKAHFAWGWSHQSADAAKGRALFKENPFPELRAVSAIFPGYVIPVGRPGVVDTWSDMRGKKVNFGPMKGGGYLASLMITKYHGIEPEDMRISATDFSQMPMTFNDGIVDAAIVIGSIPHLVPNQIEASTKAVILSMDDEIADKIVAENEGWAKLIFPEGTFKGQGKRTVTVGGITVVNTHADVDDDVVYEMTKAIWTHRDRMVKVHPVFKNISKELVPKGITYKFHPGAEKFWKEIGAL